jgi:hypothetical protein
MNMSRFGRLILCAAAVVLVPAGVSAQTELGPKVEKTYGEGLPRDSSRLIFADSQYPVWPLTPEQKQYASINGARMSSTSNPILPFAIAM